MIHKIIRLKPKGHPQNNEHTQPRTVLITRETEKEWHGFPVANKDCPELTWPKFAWEEA